MRIDFRALPPNFAQFVHALKCTLMVFAKGYSSAYVGQLFWSFMHFARAIPTWPGAGATITPREIGIYVASLESSASIWHLSGLNPLLQKWKANRLRRENDLLLEQFQTWAVNAERHGVTIAKLNAPLALPNRERSQKTR